MTKDLEKEVEDLLEKSRAYKGSTSRLRKEITKVSLLTTPAVQTLYKHLNNERVPDQLIKDAKWTISMLQALYETAIKEETVKTRKAATSRPTAKKPGAKPKAKKPPAKEEPDQSQDESHEDPEPKSNFSLDYEPEEKQASGGETVAAASPVNDDEADF